MAKILVAWLALVLSFAGQAQVIVANGQTVVTSGGSPVVGGGSGPTGFYVSGNQIKNAAGVVQKFRGVNLQGLDSSGAQGDAPWYGPAPNGTPPSWATLATWTGNNAVRIPLNAASYLGLTCYQINSGGTGWVSGTPTAADPYGNYRSALNTAIATAQAAGYAVIIDLHWSAPQFTFAGVTGCAMPLWQPPFMNAYSDQPFWLAIANTYGSQAAPITVPGVGTINNANIFFELFNEPYLDQESGYGNSSTTWSLYKNGGTVATFYTNSSTSPVSQSWTLYGFQQALNEIRGTGAKNVILVGSVGYSHALSGWTTFAPVDTLVPAQIVAVGHFYNNNAYPYTGNNLYPNVFPDSGSATTAWANNVLAVQNTDNVPVWVTETGGYEGPSYTSGEPFVTYIAGWADTNNVAGLMEWTWWQPAPSTSNNTNFLLTPSQTPTTGQGATWKAYLGTL